MPERGSDTALFAHVAYQLSGVGSKEAGGLAERLGLAVGTSPILHATREHPASARGRRMLRKWVLVDERKLGLGTALVRLAAQQRDADDAAADELYRRAALVAGVRQLMLSEAGAEILAVVVTDGPADADRLREELAAVGRVLAWESLRRETWEPAVDTWGHLARLRARKEGLLRP